MTPLKAIREKRSLTGREVSSALGIDLSHYYKVESGKSTASPELAEKISLLFGGAVTELQILYPERYMLPDE